MLNNLHSIDVDDCGSYWECYNGVLTYMSCSDCYRYDADRKSCEQPERVECGSRPADDSCQVKLTFDTQSGSTV